MHKDKGYNCRLSSTVSSCSLLVLLFLTWMPGCSSSDLNFPSEYQAVFMDNGQIFYGKLQDTKSSFLMLHDVYTTRTLTNQEKKETRLIMAPRGIELHNPDFMRLNTSHVVAIEPVGPESRVAQLIREAKLNPLRITQGPPPTPPPATTPAATPPTTAPSSQMPASSSQPTNHRDKNIPPRR